MIVIDTQALVWHFQGDPRLGSAARRIVEETRETDAILIPAIVAWEIGMLADKDRIVLGMTLDLWFMRVLSEPGFVMTPLDVTIGIDAGTLPGDIHGDPADRLIIATGRAVGEPILTADEKILRYAAAGHVKAIDARK